MKIEEYLSQYDRELIRTLTWLKSNGVNTLSAMGVIQSYADEEKVFESGSALDQAILIDSFKKEANPLRDFIDAVNLLKSQNLMHSESVRSMSKFHMDIKDSYDSMANENMAVVKDLRDINDTKKNLMESIGIINNELKGNSQTIEQVATSLVDLQKAQSDKSLEIFQTVTQPIIDLTEALSLVHNRLEDILSEFKTIGANEKSFMDWFGSTYTSFFEFIMGLQARIGNESASVLNNSAETKSTLDAIMSLKEQFTGDTATLKSVVENEVALIDIIDKSRQTYINELDKIKNVFVQSLQAESDSFRNLSRGIRDDMITLKGTIEEAKRCLTQKQ